MGLVSVRGAPGASRHHSRAAGIVRWLLWAAMGSTGGFAQDDQSNPVLEEVLVFATKRVENLQNVPVAVTALSGRLISLAQIDSSQDLTDLVPSLTLDTGGIPGTSSFRIRGMGTLLSEDECRAGLTVSGPLTDTLRYRFAASGTDRGGYTRNYYDGQDINGRQEWNLRGKVLWLATDKLDLKWTGDYNELSCDCNESAPRSLDPFDGNDDQVQTILDRLAPVVPAKSNQAVNINRPPSSDLKSWGNSLTANWYIGRYALTSITAWRGFKFDSFWDLDSQPIDVVDVEDFFVSDQEDQFTQELAIPG